MAFLVSPAVSVTETDLTNIIPQVATSSGATVGEFLWGPALERVFVSNEDELANIFGKPSVTLYKDFLVCSSFLSYTSNLQVVRVVGTGALNASATASAGGTGQLIQNKDVYDATSFSASPNLWVAKYPGTLGNAIGVAWADATGFNDTDSNGEYTWQWRDLFTDVPASNEYHIVVYDATGEITGTANTALEKFAFVSSTTTAIGSDGQTAYFKEVINRQSAWIYVGKTSLLAGTSGGITLAGGAHGSAPTDGMRIIGFDLFADPEVTDVSLVFQAGGGLEVGQHIISNIAEVRKDCIALVSPLETDVVNAASVSAALEDIQATRASYGSSSYAVMDSAYKLMYDRYNDVNRYVPLNGDIAGLCAQTDADTDPWFSPAGPNRGHIKNCVKLSVVQSRTIRDELYKSGINPCVAFPLDGPLLYGDKTLQSKPSAFDRINVRRLFITLEKAIATSAKYTLFEFNDEFTRARFVNQIVPFLRDVQGRRGITDFRVVCDSTNNTGQVIDNQEFVADIYIKPNRAINFIKLNFIAVRTGVSFEEVVQGGTV